MQQIQLHNKYGLVITLILCAALSTPVMCTATTVVSNNVSVSANSSNSSSNGSDGESHTSASVTTVVNGKVVESWSASSTEDISYERTISISHNNATPTNTTDQVAEQVILKQIITRLQALIQLYVTLSQQ